MFVPRADTAYVATMKTKMGVMCLVSWKERKRKGLEAKEGRGGLALSRSKPAGSFHWREGVEAVRKEPNRPKE